MKLKMELHSHTDFDPVDWIEYSAKDLIDEAARQGVEILAITCHKSLEWSKSLEEYASSAGVMLIPAVEASIEGKDVLIYGIQNYTHPMTFAQLRAMRAMHPDVLTIAPHPFYPSKSCLGKKLFQYHDCFDAIEYCHFYTRQVNFNQKAVDAAGKLKKPMIGTSDIHFLSQMGKTTSSVIVQEKSLPAIIKAIKAGRVELNTAPLEWIELGQLLAKITKMDVKKQLFRLGVLTRKPATVISTADE